MRKVAIDPHSVGQRATNLCLVEQENVEAEQSAPGWRKTAG